MRILKLKRDIRKFESCRPSHPVGLSALLLVSAGGAFRPAMPDRLSKANKPLGLAKGTPLSERIASGRPRSRNSRSKAVQARSSRVNSKASHRSRKREARSCSAQDQGSVCSPLRISAERLARSVSSPALRVQRHPWIDRPRRHPHAHTLILIDQIRHDRKAPIGGPPWHERRNARSAKAGYCSRSPVDCWFSSQSSFTRAFGWATGMTKITLSGGSKAVNMLTRALGLRAILSADPVPGCDDQHWGLVRRWR